MDAGVGGRFATTLWSLVLAAGERGGAEAEEALARLCAQYWYPVFAFMRRKGHGRDDAEDLTQGEGALVVALLVPEVTAPTGERLGSPAHVGATSSLLVQRRLLLVGRVFRAGDRELSFQAL